MCDVPSIAVFCSESIECFPGTATKFFLKLLVTIPVAPIIIIIINIIINFLGFVYVKFMFFHALDWCFLRVNYDYVHLMLW